jgi:hypothetical protein
MLISWGLNVNIYVSLDGSHGSFLANSYRGKTMLWCTSDFAIMSNTWIYRALAFYCASSSWWIHLGLTWLNRMRTAQFPSDSIICSLSFLLTDSVLCSLPLSCLIIASLTTFSIYRSIQLFTRSVQCSTSRDHASCHCDDQLCFRKSHGCRLQTL